MITHYIAQGTLPNALQWPKWEGNPKKEGMHVLIYLELIHFAIEQKLTLQCKATMLQKGNSIMLNKMRTLC